MENTLKKPMTGIIPPLVTPLLDNDKLDIDGLERLIERLIKGECTDYLYWVPLERRRASVTGSAMK